MWSEDLSTIAPDLKTVGVELHGVGTSRKGLDEFQSVQFLKGKLYVDEDGAAYTALNFKELGLLDGFGLLSPAAHKAYMEARHRRVPGNFEEAEKGMQMGGTIVISPKGGKGGQPAIVFMHSQTGYADQPDPQDILKAVQGALNANEDMGPEDDSEEASSR